MRAKNPDPLQGFTLLELVVVLAILAIMTAIAIREVGSIQQGERYLASQKGLDALELAILGDPATRQAAAAGGGNGFVSDVGRLPQTVAYGVGTNSLGELWTWSGATYDIRPALLSNGVAAAYEDSQVLVPCGWRGPYLRLARGDDTVRDGWGRPYVTPDASGYGRLRSLDDQPLVAGGQPIRLIRHLGDNGTRDTLDTGYDRDVALVLSNQTFAATLQGHVEVLGRDQAPAEIDAADTVSVRVFSPDPDQAGKITVWVTNMVFSQNPLVWEVPATAGLTLGTRVVRAYFDDANASTNTLFRKSAVKTVVLAAGSNYLDMQIDR